ncbi:unnamed protein product [Strongylus vulgaris]|uniref:ShKT domain-containing protein n=1 Tax=Strongylus vulgaris TaxID=40348 RepID=A0A3P7IMY4_STRVU|nr:unnamed protein product [Strongylus vulgaris]
MCSTIPLPLPCIDRVNPKTGKSDCSSMAHLCGNGKYYLVMHEQCPQTCGRCDSNGRVIPPPPVIPGGCVDFSTKECLRLAIYCHHPIYKDLMKQQCRKSCGYCY